LSSAALLLQLFASVDAMAAIALRAVATPSNAAAGERVRYAVTVSNSGSLAQSVTLTGSVPVATTVAKSELSLAAFCDGVGSYTTCAAGQTLQFVGFNVAAGASVTVVYRALISTGVPPPNGTLLNSDVWVEDTTLGNEYQLNVAAIAASTALGGMHVTASALPAQARAGGTARVAEPNAAGRQQNGVRLASSLGPKAAPTQASIRAPGAANVPASTDTRIVVILDHALIDGRNWTPNADDGWLNDFAERCLTERKVPLRLIVEQGGKGVSSLDEFDVSGTLGRLQSSALTQRAAQQVVFIDGIGDFHLLHLQNPELTATQIIAIHRHIIESVPALGLKIFGATIISFEGSTLAGNTALSEANRLAVNQWIRNSGAYDAVVDFDLATSDPRHSARLLPAYDSGDHMHPNDAGYQAMAEAIDLSFFDE
jgi:lysophospholipase L1-like esterase